MWRTRIVVLLFRRRTADHDIPGSRDVDRVCAAAFDVLRS
jgi:hypothetical protein